MADIASKLAKRESRKAFRAQNRAYIEAVADAAGTPLNRPETGLGASNACTKARKSRKAKKRRKKSLSNSKLEAIRWEAFAAVIRERDEDRGCFVCKIGAVEQAGHTIPRGRAATKYHEENVHGWCAKCNYMDDQTPGYHDWAVIQHIAVYGVEQYQGLVSLSRTTLQESRQEILSSAWGYIQRMSEGERKEKLRAKLAPLVPTVYGGTMEAKEN